MGGTEAPLTGPDLAQGVELDDVPRGGSLLGQAQGEAVLLVRPAESDEVFAVGAVCTHYGGPLAEGIVAGREVRCPWHHARFDARTGESSAPALEGLACWKIERRGSRVVVAGKRDRAVSRPVAGGPESIVIVGAGAAGQAAAEMLRREGYAGPVTLIGADEARPVDRPNLSKDYLAGTAPEEWVFLRGEEFYAAQRIELLRGSRAVALDPAARHVELADGSHRGYGALLLATGADPVRLSIPGGDAPHVCYLRTLADSRAIIDRVGAGGTRRAVVVGASFIGLEVAASLRQRSVEVQVVAPGARPLERVLGPELGDFVRALHEAHGVRFHLGHTLRAIEPDAVVLDDGARLSADLVVAGVGVRPALELAEAAGLAVDRGVLVDEYLETSASGVWAAGDIARFPDPRTGRRARIEHWVVAERQGQTAARNMLGQRTPFRQVPFFWSQHYDVTIAYVGHAESWERIEVAGRLGGEAGALVAFRSAGRIAAVATIGRDRDSLDAERLLERDDQEGLEALVRRAGQNR